MPQNKTTILLVDDDSLARIGILSLIPFAENGFEIVGEADNGQRALALALQLKPDIILTDVIMPGLNGVELIRECKKNGLRSQFIVLSSHDDFKFVKDALKEGAADYILKTELEKDFFLELLCKIAEKIFSLHLEKNSATNSPAKKLLLAAEQEHFLKQNLLQNQLLSEETYEQAQKLFKKPSSAMFCLLVTISGVKGEPLTEQDLYRLEVPAKNAFKEVIRQLDGAVCVHLGGRNYFVYAPLILPLINPTEFKKQLQSLSRQIIHVCKYMLDVAASIGVSKMHPSIHNLSRAYTEVQTAVKQALLSENGIVFYYDVAPKTEKDSSFLSIEQDITELRNVLCNFNFLQAETCFNAIIRKIGEKTESQSEKLKGICFTLLFVLNAFLQTITIEPKTFWITDENSLPPEDRIPLLSAREDYVFWCKNIKEKLLSIVTSTEKKIKFIIDAKTYITHHYTENVTLDTVAEKTGISPAYLSKQFSKYTGMTFIDFLTQTRIEKAKELLRNSRYKVFAVSEMVGYDNTTYFSYLFKKETGMTPQEYRQKLFTENLEQP